MTDTPTIKVDLSRLNETARAAVTTFTVRRNVVAAAKLHGIGEESLKRYLLLAGIRAATRKHIEAGEPFELIGGDTEAPPSGAGAAASSEPVRLDVVERHRFETQAQADAATIRDLTKRLAAAEDHRSSILGLDLLPAEPIAKPMRRSGEGQSGKQAIVLHISDTHVGEVVEASEVMGVNSYNVEIAERRMGRLFNTASVLSTTAWPRSDGAPHKVYVLLGGDLVSGHGLHPDHLETDACTVFEQAKHAARMISAGILRWHLELYEHHGVKVSFDVISVVGNHGRATAGKPRTKLVTLQSYDTLVADFVEMSLREYTNIKHYQPRGYDAYFDVVGWPHMLSHGDRMGSGGGTGFIGPMATIVKGHRKIVDTEYRQRRPVSCVWTGHFHTTGMTPFGFANGSGIGYGEFARSIRADPEPARQNYGVFHERYGLLRYQPIVIGTPDEGTIYQPNGGLLLPSLGA